MELGGDGQVGRFGEERGVVGCGGGCDAKGFACAFTVAGGEDRGVGVAKVVFLKGFFGEHGMGWRV